MDFEEDLLDGRTFRATANEGGDVGSETAFEFQEDDGLVWARYAGGSVRLGFLVGLRAGDELFVRYAQVTTEGGTATGHSEDRVEVLDDGRVRLHESWAWDSREGSGTSVLEEVVEQGDRGRRR